MNFFRIVFILLIMLLASSSFADDSTQKQEVEDQVKEIAKEIQDDEDVPLNDPFAGNEGNNSMSGNIPEEEQQDEMSLYNFKLVGLISGKDHSYISLVNAGGEVITLTLGQYLGKIEFVDLRLAEAIFKKEDESYIILDFNNQIREANEY